MDISDRHFFWTRHIFLSAGVFFRDLPQDPWERFFSPILQVPAVTSFIVSYRILVVHKLMYASNDLMFKYYLWGVGLMSLGFVAALLGSLIVD